MIDLNSWLLHEGYIALKRDAMTRIRLALWRMGFDYSFLIRHFLLRILRYGARWIETSPYKAIELLTRKRRGIMLSLDDIDWTTTKAFCRSAFGGIYLNVVGVHPHGVVQPDEYHALREEIVRKLKSLRDPDTGQVIGGNLFLKEDVYSGPLAANGPDIIYLPMERTYLPANLGFCSRRYIMQNLFLPGNHHLNGVLIAAGKFIETAVPIKCASLMDLAPTIIYLLGGQIPRDIDGRVLQEIITADFHRTNAIQFIDSADDKAEPSDGLSAADRQNIITKLEELGYL
jgi:predicted AlkP superfamily phosphohydrolase/phosphomutase